MPSVIPLTAPDITQVELDAVAEVLRNAALTEGPKLEEFERSCAQLAGRSHGIGVCSGTSAIYCSLLGTGISAGNEVITTPFSLPAATHCILAVDAKPVFVDIHPKTLNIDPAALEAAITPQTKAIVACEALGHVYHHVYGLDVVMLRFFTVYGPRQRPDLAIHQFTRRIYAGQPIEQFGDGTTRRDYTYIDDIIQGLVAAIDRPFGFEVFNLGESFCVSLSELVEAIEKASSLLRPRSFGLERFSLPHREQRCRRFL